MNKLQQEIIEIIEPYMDKTLSEGCYIKKYEWRLDFSRRKIWQVDNWEFLLQYFTSSSTIRSIGYLEKILEVYGHYDITAVLKYIKSFDWIMCYCFDDWNKFQIYKLADVNQDFWYYYIPNKPLHLYTEQENLHLLELLKKLWQTK